MAKETQRRIAFAATVLVLGSLALFGCGRFFGGGASFADDDRPPIIVRNGSLTFESGSKKRLGKWRKVDDASKKEWELDDDNGKKTATLHVYFVGGTDSGCVPETAEEVTVYYNNPTGPSTGAKQYTVKINRSPKKGKDVPMVSAPDDLEVDNTNMKLTASPADWKLTKVTIRTTTATLECTAPREVWIESIK